MKHMYVHLTLLVLVLGAVIAGVFFMLNGRHSVAQAPKPPAAQESAAKPQSQVGFDLLKGRWQRPDGGYVIEIRAIDATGKMDAGYFNPRPINVSQAQAALDGTTLKVFIELRDTNYPGATYHLTYDPGADQLRGRYFQPKLQQTFDVFFVRMR
jgi:hypothetical protein